MNNDLTLELHFSSIDAPELIQTRFVCPRLDMHIIGIRGCNVPNFAVPFKWGVASHALCLFFVKTVDFYNNNKLNQCILSGVSKSPANTITNLLYKRPTCWLLDLFGVDISGRSLLKRPILCCNALKRRPGPIKVYFRTGFYKAENIRIYIDQKDISRDITKDTAAISLLSQNLEQTWHPGAYVNVREDVREEILAENLEENLAA